MYVFLCVCMHISTYVPLFSGVADIPSRFCQDLTMSMIVRCLLFAPLGPDHHGCASGNAVTDLAHVFRHWWNTILCRFPCSTPVTHCPVVEYSIATNANRQPRTTVACVHRSGLWELRMSSPVDIFEISWRPDLLQGGGIGTPAIDA